MSLHPHSDKTRKEAALCIQKWTRGYLCRRTIETARAAKERISRYDEDIERQVHAVRGIEMWWARVAGLSLSESQESTHTESSASSSVLSTASQLVTRLVSRVMESACTTSPVDPSLQEEIYSFYHPANADSPPLASPSPDAISSHLLSACLMRNENDGDALLNTIFSTPNAISSLCAEEAMLRGDHINTFFMSHFTVEELLWRGMIDVEERKGWGEVRTEAHGSALEVVVMEVEGTERQGRAEVLEEEWESWTNLISTSNAGGVEAFYSEELLARSGIEGMRDSGISELLSSCRDSVVRKRNSIHQREWYATLATTIATETSARDSIFSAECSEFSDTISVSFLITSEILSRSSLFSNWIATFTPFISFIETHQRSFIETEGFALCTSLYSKVAAKNADNIIQIETKERSLIVIEEGRVYNEVQSILDAAEGLEERQAVVELYKAAEVEVAGLLPPLREGLAEKGATCIDASAVKEARQQLRELQKAYNEVCCTMCDARTLTNRLLGITKEREMLQGRLDTHVFHQLRLETAVAECEAECASLRNTYLDSENTTNAFQSIQRLEEIATQHRATRVQHITGAAEVSQQLSDTTLQRSTEVQLLKLTMHRDTPDRLYALYSSVAASVAALPQPAVTLPEEIDETSYVATAYERYIASALPGGGGGGDTPPRRQSVREIREGLQRKASMKKEETQPLHPPHPPKNPRRQSEPLDVEMTEEDLMQDEAVQRARIVCSAVPDVVEVQAFVTVGESMLRECISSAAVESMPTPTPPPISHTQQQIEADIEDQAMLEVKLLAIIEREDEQRSAILLSQDRVRTTLGTLEVRAGADARLRQCAATTGSKRKQAALAAQSLLAQCTPSQRRESTIQEVLAAVCAGGGGGGGGEMPSTQMVNQAVCAIVRGDDVTVCTFVAKWQALMTATMQDIMEGTALSQRCAGQDQMPSWENVCRVGGCFFFVLKRLKVSGNFIGLFFLQNVFYDGHYIVYTTTDLPTSKRCPAHHAQGGSPPAPACNIALQPRRVHPLHRYHSTPSARHTSHAAGEPAGTAPSPPPPFLPPYTTVKIYTNQRFIFILTPNFLRPFFRKLKSVLPL